MLTGLAILGILLVLLAAIVVWSALVLGSRCDDEQERLRWQEQRDAIGRAAEQARRRP